MLSRSQILTPGGILIPAAAMCADAMLEKGVSPRRRVTRAVLVNLELCRAEDVEVRWHYAVSIEIDSTHAVSSFLTLLTRVETG